MAISWVCWADLAIERRVHRTSRARRAHFDTREAQLPRREVRMLLIETRSWRQGGRPQPVNQAQDLSKQRFGDSDLRELECDVAAMSHDLRADLDELVLQSGQGPVFDSLGQGQSS